MKKGILRKINFNGARRYKMREIIKEENGEKWKVVRNETQHIVTLEYIGK